jgi:hypothetical protein
MCAMRLFGRCALAPSGHAAAAPPRSVMNSRRFNGQTSPVLPTEHYYTWEAAALRDFYSAYDRCGSESAVAACPR